MYCLDWQKYGPELYGTWATDMEFAALDVMVVPCGMSYERIDGKVELPREDCNWDEQAAWDHIKSANIIVLHNKISFQTDGYQDERLLK